MLEPKKAPVAGGIWRHFFKKGDLGCVVSKAMQHFPRELVESIFTHSRSNAVADKSCVSLASTCRLCKAAFADSGVQERCRKAAFKRLLKWRVREFDGLAQVGGVAMACTYTSAKLSPRRTERLVKWLDDGLMTIDDLWEAQLPLPPLEKGKGMHRRLTLQIHQRFLKGHVLYRSVKAEWSEYMTRFGEMAMSEFDHVRVLHSPLNGEAPELLASSDNHY